MSFLEPDRYFSRLSQIDIERDLLTGGYRFVLLDVDNTILRRDTHEVPRDVGYWLAKARNAGVSFCLVSNNWHGTVYQLADRLSLPIVAKAMKPFPPAFLVAMRKIGATRKGTVVIGDQLVTDVLGAHFLGMKAYLLAPLVEQDLPHTLLLRNIERLVMREREPEGTIGVSGVPGWEIEGSPCGPNVVRTTDDVGRQRVIDQADRSVVYVQGVSPTHLDQTEES